MAAPQASSGAAATAVAQELEGTERRLYDAVRRAPRDARARLALGDWLASRGQLRSGAVLLEEARLFGADASVIAGRLRHLYFWLRDWSSLAALPASPLTTDEKARVAVLAQRAATHSGADSTVVPFAPLEVGALGRIPVVLGADTVWGEVDPVEEGLVLPGLGRGAGLVEVYGAAPRGAIGVVREMGVGDGIGRAVVALR
ncbi:MAG: hypothetical protein H3C62_11430, partial [Gemmatimonadaceae bacterium]|nr:hypothetical protein [Gemmatimonadaceae bacterium]